MEEMTRVTGEPSTRQLQGLTKPGVIMFVVDITDNTESQPGTWARSEVRIIPVLTKENQKEEETGFGTLLKFQKTKVGTSFLLTLLGLDDPGQSLDDSS